jgi:hypothetical protein
MVAAAVIRSLGELGLATVARAGVFTRPEFGPAVVTRFQFGFLVVVRFPTDWTIVLVAIEVVRPCFFLRKPVLGNSFEVDWSVVTVVRRLLFIGSPAPPSTGHRCFIHNRLSLPRVAVRTFRYRTIYRSLSQRNSHAPQRLAGRNDDYC